jgi:hypothetical protein
VAVTALRSALAAIENAEAVEAATAPTPSDGGAEVAGSVAGLGATEADRRVLTEGEVEELVAEEVAERLSVALRYDQLGQGGRADRLRAEAEVLSRYLPRS